MQILKIFILACSSIKVQNGVNFLPDFLMRYTYLNSPFSIISMFILPNYNSALLMKRLGTLFEENYTLFLEDLLHPYNL